MDGCDYKWIGVLTERCQTRYALQMEAWRLRCGLPACTVLQPRLVVSHIGLFSH